MKTQFTKYLHEYGFNMKELGNADYIFFSSGISKNDVIYDFIPWCLFLSIWPVNIIYQGHLFLQNL